MEVGTSGQPDKLMKKFNEFCSKYGVFALAYNKQPFVPLLAPGIDDYIGMRNMLFLTIRLLELSNKPEVTFVDLQNVGFGLEFDTTQRKPDRDPCIASATIKVKGTSYGSELKKFESIQNFRKVFESVIYGYSVSDGYSVSVGECSNHARLFIPLDCAFETSSDCQECARQILARLTTLHFSGVVYVEGWPSERIASTGTSALWISFIQMLKKTKASSCKACQKPMLVTSERGRPRLFCSGACREWESNHKNQTRNMRIIE